MSSVTSIVTRSFLTHGAVARAKGQTAALNPARAIHAVGGRCGSHLHLSARRAVKSLQMPNKASRGTVRDRKIGTGGAWQRSLSESFCEGRLVCRVQEQQKHCHFEPVV
eukprot:1325549-Pyramimonas_sp.AAC.2